MTLPVVFLALLVGLLVGRRKTAPQPNENNCHDLHLIFLQMVLSVDLIEQLLKGIK